MKTNIQFNGATVEVVINRIETVGVTLKSTPSPDFDGATDWSVNLADGGIIGEGESSNDAIANAQYAMMNRSREEAKGGQ